MNGPSHFLDRSIPIAIRPALQRPDHRRAEAAVLAFYRLPFEPYASIRRQFLNVLRAVNRVRKAAGFEILPTEDLPLKRRIVRPFELADYVLSRDTAASAPGQ